MITNFIHSFEIMTVILLQAIAHCNASANKYYNTSSHQVFVSNENNKIDGTSQEYEY